MPWVKIDIVTKQCCKVEHILRRRLLSFAVCLEYSAALRRAAAAHRGSKSGSHSIVSSCNHLQQQQLRFVAPQMGCLMHLAPVSHARYS